MSVTSEPMISPPRGLQEVKETYGWIRIERDPIQGGWRIYDPIGWEAANLIGLENIPGLPPARRLAVHKLVAGPLLAALGEAQRSCPDYKIYSIGCFNPRPKRSDPAQLSLHSWAVAVDINPATNPAVRVKKPGDQFASDMPRAFIDAFRQNGWTWGGDFKGTYRDPMHFQFASGY